MKTHFTGIAINGHVHQIQSKFNFVNSSSYFNIQLSKINFMRQLTLFISFLMIFSCGQSDTKQKELELKERELALKEKELDLKENQPNTQNIVEIKCNSDHQLSGTLVGIFNDGPPCDYTYLKIKAENGKEILLFLDGNFSNLKVNDKSLFNWSDTKIKTFLSDNFPFDGPLPNEALNMVYINKRLEFCCIKKQINCGDDPNSPKEFFCKKIIDGSTQNQSTSESINKTNPELPFIGEKYFNFYGGTGTGSTITIDKAGLMTIKGEPSMAAAESGAKGIIEYKGPFKPIIKTKDGIIYKIEADKISIVDAKGNIERGCGNLGDEPCSTTY